MNGQLQERANQRERGFGDGKVIFWEGCIFRGIVDKGKDRHAVGKLGNVNILNNISIKLAKLKATL